MCTMIVWAGKEADDVIVIAESYRPSGVCIGRDGLYWPSCSVSADIITHMI